MSDHRVAYSRRYGAPAFWERIAQWPVARMLHHRALRHVDGGRRQLVVFAFDTIGRQIALEGAYEVRELETLMAWLGERHPQVFEGAALDIGANIGNHSLFFAERFAKVLSFEPNPRTFQVLALNAALASNIECRNVGLSDADRSAGLTFHGGNVGGSSVTGADQPGAIRIELVTVDCAVAPDEPVRLMKIDVEGHELQVLRGAERTIRAHRPLILFEQRLEDFAGGSSPVVEQLRAYGYRRFATIKPYPRHDRGGAIGAALTVLGRMVRGETMKVAWVDRIEPGFHSFVIAAPEWLGEG